MIGLAASQAIGKVWDASQAAGRKAAQERGNTFHTVPVAELDGWIKASAPLYDDFVADMDKRGLPGRPECLDGCRGQVHELIVRMETAKV